MILRLSIFALIILTGCGYHFGQGGALTNYKTIAVPYVLGDRDGDLTAAIIKKVSQSGFFKYHNNHSELILDVKIIDHYDQNVGYRYDRDRKGKLISTVIPTETRIHALVEVNVTETATGCVLLGPTRLRASYDFDHDYYASPNGVNIFSLGQLSDYDAAHDAVFVPLNRVLAEKIVDYITESW